MQLVQEVQAGVQTTRGGGSGNGVGQEDKVRLEWEQRGTLSQATQP